jgi:hypothetical protein
MWRFCVFDAIQKRKLIQSSMWLSCTWYSVLKLTKATFWSYNQKICILYNAHGSQMQGVKFLNSFYSTWNRGLYWDSKCGHLSFRVHSFAHISSATDRWWWDCFVFILLCPVATHNLFPKLGKNIHEWFWNVSHHTTSAWTVLGPIWQCLFSAHYKFPLLWVIQKQPRRHHHSLGGKPKQSSTYFVNI